MSDAFRISNLLVLPFWALMMLLPRRRWTTRIMRSPLVSVAPAALYAALVLPRLSAIWPAISRPTIGGVAALLGSPAGATIAWVHFLAFDLFIGRWIYLDSLERRVSGWLVAPALFLTLMLGPTGFLFYLAARAAVATRGSVNLRRLLRRAFEVNRPLTFLGVAMLVTFAATLVGILVDHRVITRAPAWLKPAKFAISVCVYCFTFVWLLGFVENRPRWTRLVANLTVASFIVEMTVIVTQAARGTTSHFNMTTPLDSFLWIAMGAFIVFVWAMNIVLAILLIAQRMPDRAFAWSLRLGVIVSAIGMAAGVLMIAPTPEQVAAIESGDGPKIVGAHSVGVPDGGPGLPVVGWSTVGGDLRVAHFVGLHALQILPFVGWLLTRRTRALAHFTAKDRLGVVRTIGMSYAGLVLLLAWQALRGESVIHPGLATIVAAGLLVAGCATSMSLIAERVLFRIRTSPIPVHSRKENSNDSIPV